MSVEHDYEILRGLCEKYRNWGKWGPDDQLGMLNYITPEKVIQAARLVRKGKIFSLAIPFDSKGPQNSPHNRRFNPIHFMLRDGGDKIPLPGIGSRPESGAADDAVLLATHGATHWDALAHGFWEHKMWNGYDNNLVSSAGATKNGIENYRDKIVTRGVLLDVARLKGVDCLEIGYAITNEDLDAAVKMAGADVGTGDIILVRTGYTGLCRRRGEWGTYISGDAPGLSVYTAEWLQNHQVAGVAADTMGVEVRPAELKWGRAQPWHKVVLPNMGILMGEIFDMEELSADCAEDRVYEFMLAAPPLPLTGCAGSPINPLAIK